MPKHPLLPRPRKITSLTDDYTVKKFEMRDVVTQRDWEDSQGQVVAMLRTRTAHQIAQWIMEEGLVELESEYDIAQQRTLVTQTFKALKRTP